MGLNMIQSIGRVHVWNWTVMTEDTSHMLAAIDGV